VPAPASPSPPPAAVATAPTVATTPLREEDDAVEAAPSRADRRPTRFGIDLSFDGTIGLGGTAGGVGAAGGVHWFPISFLSFRLGASGQTGTLNEAEANLFLLGMSAGVAYHPIALRPDRPIGFTVRADYVLTRQSLSHFDSDDPAPVARVRWLSGFDLFLEGNVRLTSQIGLLAGIGLTDVMASTYIDVRGAQVAVLPPLRVTAEVGLRLQF
jgi:hypothetical protein